MATDMDWDELEFRVADALVRLRKDPATTELTAKTLGVAADVHPGRADEVLRYWDLTRTMRGAVALTAEQYQRIEGIAAMRVRRPHQGTNNNVTVHGNHVQAHAGGGGFHGTQHNTLTYADVLENLVTTIERSDLPEEKKALARGWLAKFTETVVLPSHVEAGEARLFAPAA